MRKSVLVSAYYSLQQVTRRLLPKRVKDLLNRIFIPLRSPPPILDDWDIGLVGGSPIIWPCTHWTERPEATHLVQPRTRCLLLTESLDSSGMDEFVAFLARRLPEQGITTAVLLDAECPNWREGKLASALKNEGISVFSATSRDGGHTIAKWSPNVIYSHSASTWPLVYAQEQNIAALEALHGMHNVFGRSSEELAKRRRLLRRIIAVSESVRIQYLHRDAEAHPGFIVTIPNGINKTRTSLVDRVAARSALGLNDEFLFLSLARHCMQKNTYGLADAFLEFAHKEPRAHLLICGRADDASYTQRVLQLRAQGKRQRQLHLRANTERIDVLLSAADAFILNSFFEGWSLASMEAFGVGLPAILADVGGAREQLEGGPPRGVLVSNPLGNPLSVDWTTIAAARFGPQQNRIELISAMAAFVGGNVELASRNEIRAYALDRFNDDRCLRAHAGVIHELGQQRRF